MRPFAKWSILAGGGALLFTVMAGISLSRLLDRFDKPFDQRRLAVTPGPSMPLGRAEQGESLRAFYSGHSLSDGIPEEVLGIAQSLGRGFDFEFQSLPGSLIRERTKGPDRSADGWPGLKMGRNRKGSGLDVEAELKKPHDVLVVTERHDLPYVAAEEGTRGYLRFIHDRLIAKNPQAQTLFYHGWLDIKLDRPEAFVRYERAALVLWECMASAVNRELTAAGRSDRIRVLPGATAMAELVERLARGDVPGAPGKTSAERVSSLFSDEVHLSRAGKYFMGAVHFAALYGKSPENAVIPPEIPVEFGKAMQKLAWEHIDAYSTRATAAAAREVDVCRDYATYVMCPLFIDHVSDGGPIERLRDVKRRLTLQRRYADPNDPENPFR